MGLPSGAKEVLVRLVAHFVAERPAPLPLPAFLGWREMGSRRQDRYRGHSLFPRERN